MAVQSFRFSTTATTQVDTSSAETVEPSYPERYIFLVLALVIIVKILRILNRHRMEHEFDRYLDQPAASNNGSITVPYLPEYTPLPDEITSIAIRPSDDPYVAGVSSLSAVDPEVLPPPAYQDIARKSTRQRAALLPPAYIQAKSSLPPPEPLDLPGSDLDFERHS